MGTTVRSVLAVIAGFVAASAVMMLVEGINGHVLYPELGRSMHDLEDKEAIRAALAGAPTGAWLVVLLGWVLASLVGGFLAGSIGRTAPVRHALILGGLLTLAGTFNNVALPPPGWFWVATLVAFLPAAYAGARLVPERTQARI